MNKREGWVVAPRQPHGTIELNAESLQARGMALAVGDVFWLQVNEEPRQRWRVTSVDKYSIHAVWLATEAALAAVGEG